MALRTSEGKEAALKSVDELIRFAQYVKTLVQTGPLTADQLAEITGLIPDFEQQIIRGLGALYHPSSGDLPRGVAGAPAPEKVPGKPAAKTATKAAARTAARQRAKPAFRDDDPTDYLGD
jgi:hypothetical protein